jgi:aminoglycoside phosphotransferase
MRGISSGHHAIAISRSHDRHVTIVDPLLPAAAHLTGPGAFDVLRPAVDAAGGELLSCRTSHVQYRPESDLVVRYRCTIRRDDVDVTDTLLAATTAAGPFPGTVPVEATTPDGNHLTVGLWRWPFDPVLGDLATMVTPHLADAHLADLVGGSCVPEVVAYRPTERAVVRVSGRDREIYVKILPPTSVEGLVRRHALLHGAGVPVPQVLRSGEGWIAMEALTGTTLRDRLKAGTRLPAPERYRTLLDALAAVQLDDATLVRSRLDDAPHHAAMLATVLPDARDRLDDVIGRLTTLSGRFARTESTVHGDLHEAQLVVDDNEVTGLLDIDDVGRGNPLDDVATLLGHLRFRAATSHDHRIDRYAELVRAAVATGHDGAAVDLHLAAVLIGLATGPFRIQQHDWATTTRHVLDLVEHHLAASEASHCDTHDENSLSSGSSTSHT